MAKTKSNITDKEKNTWLNILKTKSDVLRPHEKELISKYLKKFTTSKNPLITHKEHRLAIAELNKVFGTEIKKSTKAQDKKHKEMITPAKEQEKK